MEKSCLNLTNPPPKKAEEKIALKITLEDFKGQTESEYLKTVTEHRALF